MVLRATDGYEIAQKPEAKTFFSRAWDDKLLS